ncbi:epidermal patterning factor-like protein [Striga asiatica]|uniref:Epidermal patterning factor-like protein n=1 Tax=Striga asiatica TaxID=4170 RepID=A0A5A7P5X5_STRAF|nr:epidermal patterning factor-like protein [Striga asiatica]
MGCPQNFVSRHNHPHFTISLLILLISSSSHFTSIFHVEGRKLQGAYASSTRVEVENRMWRVQIGSSPPRCERICGSCSRHCEAVQVPTTNPNIKAQIENSSSSDDNSNYKPLSWKCKCGNFIFNP